MRKRFGFVFIATTLVVLFVFRTMRFGYVSVVCPRSRDGVDEFAEVCMCAHFVCVYVCAKVESHFVVEAN